MIMQNLSEKRSLIYLFAALLMAVVILGMMAPGTWAAEKPEAFNKIAIIIDNSSSFAERRMEAIERTTNLLDAIAGRKIHRWEKSEDKIFLISLDAIPEVIWQGPLTELKALEPGFWAKRFDARTDYSGATDVTGCFRLAVHHLQGDPRYVGKYAIVFSDLLHSPPLDSRYKQGKPSGLPGDDFPWDGLRDVSVSVFWIPIEGKLLWRKAAEEHGLESSFAFYTTSESSAVEIKPPPRVELELTDTEREAERQRYMGYIKKLAVGLLIFILSIIVLAVAVAFGLAQVRRRQLRRPPSPGSPPGGPAQAVKELNIN